MFFKNIPTVCENPMNENNMFDPKDHVCGSFQLPQYANLDCCSYIKYEG